MLSPLKREDLTQSRAFCTASSYAHRVGFGSEAINAIELYYKWSAAAEFVAHNAHRRSNDLPDEPVPFKFKGSAAPSIYK